jgi:hypothetical protein
MIGTGSFMYIFKRKVIYKMTHVSSVILFLIFSLPSVGQQEPSAGGAAHVSKSGIVNLNKVQHTRLLDTIDSYRGYQGQGFSFDIINMSFRPDTKTRENKLKVKVLGSKSLVEFMSPKREKGRALLKDDSNLWLYIPGTRKTIRVAAAQRLLGETSNGDVLGTSFSQDYQVESVTYVNQNDVNQSDVNQSDVNQSNVNQSNVSQSNVSQSKVWSVMIWC